MTTLGVDISNYTSNLTADSLAAWKADGVGLVIVQSVDPPAGFPPGKTRLQVQQCLDAGLVVDAYIWLWFQLDVSDIQRKLNLVAGLSVRKLWLDVEDTAAKKYDYAVCVQKVADALAACDAFPTTSGEKTGIYTAHWYWPESAYMGNTEDFRDRDLWTANYDSVADTSAGFVPYGGWDHCAVKQYQGTTTFHGVSGVDLNVLSAAEAAKLTDGGTPPVDDAERAAMQDKIDGLVNSIGVIAGDLLRPVAKQPTAMKPKVVRTLVAGIRAQAEQHGIQHA